MQSLENMLYKKEPPNINFSSNKVDMSIFTREQQLSEAAAGNLVWGARFSICNIHRPTTLGGSGGMLPRKNIKI